MIRRFRTVITANKKVIYDNEDQYGYPSTAMRIVNEIRDKQLPAWPGGWNHWKTVKEGSKLSFDVHSFDVHVEIECLVNRRATRRAPEILKKEREEREAAHQARLVAKQKAEQEREESRKRFRTRVKNQIDYAFKSGSQAGTEPVAKYVTCHCDAPADFLLLNRPIARGATVLDEDTIVQALCKQHHYPQGYGYVGAVESIACSRLEFFFTGIRQISIRKEGTN